MLAALFEVLMDTTGYLILRALGRRGRHREPKDTACTLVGLAVWAAVVGVVWLAARFSGGRDASLAFAV